jgi:hypothetical protein
MGRILRSPIGIGKREREWILERWFGPSYKALGTGFSLSEPDTMVDGSFQPGEDVPDGVKMGGGRISEVP